jgi:predicted phosphodiesterase
LDNYVIDGRLPDNAVVGVVADWATGEPEAVEVLRQIRGHNPHVAIHLGDIYYAGTEHEVENYFYQPWKNILEPENTGVLSLALPGNHDLYAGGKPYYDLIDKLAALNRSDRKMASYFCVRNEHWQLIGLDTALHDRLGGGPTYLEDSEVEWLKDKIQNPGNRRTILFSHHQLFSANDRFDGKSYNERLYKQLAPIVPQVDLWLWGHEHDLVIFGEYMNLRRGRCIGGSAFPVGNFEMPTERVNPDVPYNQQVQLSKGSAFYQHCYTILKLDGANATVFYYEDRDGGKVLFQETL